MCASFNNGSHKGSGSIAKDGVDTGEATRIVQFAQPAGMYLEQLSYECGIMIRYW